MVPNENSSALSLLETRRSGRPRDMIAPGPDEAQLSRMLKIASRTPDHGQLVPYRFVIVGDDQREALASLYRRALQATEPAAPQAKIDKAMSNAHAAPCLVVLISCPTPDHKIPVFEQELTCGAAGMNLLHAATAMGFVGGWITGWPANNPMVRAAFCSEGEEIAGFFYLGQSAMALEERVRPQMERIVAKWDGKNSREG
jgi:nitroreductase